MHPGINCQMYYLLSWVFLLAVHTDVIQLLQLVSSSFFNEVCNYKNFKNHIFGIKCLAAKHEELSNSIKSVRMKNTSLFGAILHVSNRLLILPSPTKYLCCIVNITVHSVLLFSVRVSRMTHRT